MKEKQNIAEAKQAPSNVKPDEEIPEVTVPPGYFALRFDTTEKSYGFIVVPLERAIAVAKSILRKGEKTLLCSSYEEMRSEIEDLKRQVEELQCE